MIKNSQICTVKLKYRRQLIYIQSINKTTHEQIHGNNKSSRKINPD